MNLTAPYVLVVEDDRDVADLLRHHLEALGHVVRCAETGEAALTRIDQASPTLAVVDLKLPGVDGGAVIRALRDDPRHRDCRIIVASVLDPDVEEVGADVVLNKPFRRRDVARAVQAARTSTGDR